MSRPNIAGPKPIASETILYAKGTQGSGAVVDSSGKGNNLVVAAGNDAVWADAGFFSSKATAIGTDGSLSLPIGFLNTWDSNAEYLIMAMTIKGPTPAAASRLFGTSSGNGAGAAMKGFAIGTVDTSGKIGPRMNDGANNIGTASWDPVVLDDTPHKLVWMLDPITKFHYAWIDGVAVATASSWVALTGGLANTTEPLRIGRVGASTVNTRKISIRNLQIVKGTGRIPPNYMQLVALYQQNAFRPWHEGLI